MSGIKLKHIVNLLIMIHRGHLVTRNTHSPEDFLKIYTFLINQMHCYGFTFLPQSQFVFAKYVIIVINYSQQSICQRVKRLFAKCLIQHISDIIAINTVNHDRNVPTVGIPNFPCFNLICSVKKSEIYTLSLLPALT